MSIGFELDANIGLSMLTGIFPGPPGAGHGHPFELRAGPWFAGELQVISLRGRERMNDVYRYEVTFATDQAPELVTSALFGMLACLTIKSPGNDPRVIQGIAASIDALGGVAGERGNKRRRFALTIVPRLWLLRHRRRNRIFQNKSIPEIVSKVLADAGIKDSDCHWRADKKGYPPLPFVYQRGETDWDFFRRILASAGIFFFYEHASGFLDSMFGGAASAVAGAVGAAAGMIGGAVGSAVSTVESATGMVSVLCFADRATETAAVSPSALGGLAAEAEQAVLGALGGAVGGGLGDVIDAAAAAVKEPSATLAFDDDQGSSAHVERVYEFDMKKTLRSKELRMLDRDLETASSWVGVASAGAATASASVNLSAGLSLGGSLSGGGLAGALSAGISLGASFDVDAPLIPASELRQELYQEDSAVWQDTWAPGLGPWVSLSAGKSADGRALPEATVATAIGRFNKDHANAMRMGLELERVRRKYQEGAGRSDCRRMGAGYRFTLDRHPIKMLNGEYTVTALDVVGIHPDFLEEGQAVYRNRFRCVPSSVAARPKRPKRRPKPGMEVARVVNFAAGKDIGLEANSAGYVRVRFRWDILDDDYATPNGDLTLDAYQHDDIYSVWLPVVQPWAGAGYGAQFIPREGMEVLVGFMDDQSERPVILGCLYSNENPPPWPAYSDHQKVGIRSQTRNANGGWNEVSMDDRQGGELVTVRAQRNLFEHVLNDRHADIDHDSVAIVGHDETVSIGHDETLTVTNDRTVTVTQNQSHTVGGTDTVTVSGDVTHDFGANVSLTVKGTTTETLFGDLQRTLNGEVQVATQGKTSLNFSDDYTERHTGHRTVIVGTGKAHRSATLHVEGTARAYAAKPIELESREGFSIVCGDSQLLVSPQGITLSSSTITLVAKEIQAKAETVGVTSKGDLKLTGKAATVQTTGAKMALDASTASLIAPQVKLGMNAVSTSPSVDKPPTITKVQMKDPAGKPRANARVLLTKGGKDGEQRMTVLDADGVLEILGDESYSITFPDDAQGK